MPNRQTTDNNYRYEYQGQFAEKDNETNLSFFERRLYDARIGRWLKTDEVRRSYESPYLAMGNNPKYADPDGRDIIILIQRDAVGGAGHAAVLIGNDNKGWRYFSKNGTEKGYFGGDGGRMYGDNHKPDIGDKIYRGKNVSDVINQVNNNSNEKHNYDVYIRVKTNKEQDDLALNAALAEANTEKYGIFGTSCIDVPQEALKATNIDFKYKGFNNIIPNDWFINFGWYNNNRNYNLVPQPKTYTTSIEVGDVKITKIGE